MINIDDIHLGNYPYLSTNGTVRNGGKIRVGCTGDEHKRRGQRHNQWNKIKIRWYDGIIVCVLPMLSDYFDTRGGQNT